MRQRSSTLRIFTLAAGLLGGAASNAADINTLQQLTQAEFRGLSEDLGAALSFKPLIPAEPMGLSGFDIGFAVSGTKLQNRAVFQKAAAGASVPATLPVPSLRVHKGLPLNIDLGLSYAALPSSNIRLIGGEVRWAVLPGSVATPAVALRVSASSLSGVNQLDLRTTGLDVSVSKGFAVLTPYAGVGTVRVKSDAKGNATQTTESFNQTKLFGGLNLNFGLVNWAFEVDKTGQATSYGLKFGLRF
ncbi:MAG: hypothetical protein WA210_21035 [Burkholderiaceae bacterium]